MILRTRALESRCLEERERAGFPSRQRTLLLYQRKWKNNAILHNRRIAQEYRVKMSTLFGSASSTNTANTLGDLSKDVALQNPPEDSVSDINFSPQSQHLAVASWDKKVRIYEIAQSGGSTGVAAFEHEAPVLSCHWSPVSSSSCMQSHFTKFFTGWQESSGRRGRQGGAYDGYDNYANNTSCSTRPTYSLRPVLHTTSGRRCDACYRFMG